MNKVKYLSSRNIQSKDSGIMGEACQLGGPVTELWFLYSMLLGGGLASLELNIPSLDYQVITGNLTHLTKNRLYREDREETWFQRSTIMSLVPLRQYVSDLIPWKEGSEIRFECLLSSCKY